MIGVPRFSFSVGIWSPADGASSTLRGEDRTPLIWSDPVLLHEVTFTLRGCGSLWVSLHPPCDASDDFISMLDVVFLCSRLGSFRVFCSPTLHAVALLAQHFLARLFYAIHFVRWGRHCMAPHSLRCADTANVHDPIVALGVL